MNLDSESNPSTNPGSIQFLSQMEVGGRGVLGPPTPSITLPSLLASLPPGAPAIIKMDIQGQECRVLRSPGIFNTSHAIPYIFMEWNEVFFKNSLLCPNPVGLLEVLEAQGYSPRWSSLVLV